MDTEELVNKVKSALSKGAAGAMSAFEKAGDKVQKFSDSSVVKIEKKQLEMKRDTKYQLLGEKLSALIAEKKLELPESAAIEIEPIQKEIENLSAQIKEKSDLLEKESSEN